MDIINIGNDIKITFKLKNVVYTLANDVKCLKCYFIKYDDLCDINCTFPPYYNPTEYTIHSCGYQMYNVTPCNTCNKHCFCGFSVNSHDICCKHILFNNRAYGCNIPSGWDTNKPLSVYFNGRDQKECGKYKLLIHVVLFEQGWGNDNTHEYLIDYGNVFNIVSQDGMSGNIIIDLTKQDENNPSRPDLPDDDYDHNSNYWYVGQITATKLQFNNLSDYDLINNAVKVSTDVKSKELTVNNSCWYVLIPETVKVKNAQYVCDVLTSEFDRDSIVNRTSFDVLHDNIIIDGIVYNVFAYRSYAFTITPAISTFNIE